MVWDRGRLHLALIAIATPLIVSGIAVEHLTPHAAVWRPNLVVETRYRREVADHQDAVAGRPALAQKAYDTAFDVITIYPGEGLRVAVTLIERWCLSVEMVQVRHPPLQASVWRKRQQMPVQAGIVMPLAPLAELPTHEEELFADLSIHIAQQESEVGEFLCVIPWHFAQQGAFAIDDLVVRQGQNKIFAE